MWPWLALYATAASSRTVQTWNDLPGEYHTYDSMLETVRGLAPQCEQAGVKLWTSRAEQEGVRVDTVHLSTEAKSAGERFRVHVVHGEHPRELISPEVGLRAIRALCAQDAPCADCGPAFSAAERSLVQQAEAVRMAPIDWQIVLNANPRTRDAIEKTGNFCLRNDPNNVDLNRNFDDHWENERGHGSKPFSEVEARILRDAVADFKPHVFVSVHSGRNSMYTPHAYETGADDTSMPEYRVLQSIAPLCDGCDFGQAGRLQGMTIGGSSFDWAKDVAGAGYSFAFEVFMDASATPQDPDGCFKFFNPATKQQYAETTSTYANALLETARLALDDHKQSTDARADEDAVRQSNLRLARQTS